MRRIRSGVEIGSLRIFWRRKNWRTKDHPYWFFQKWGRVITFQSGPLEIFWYGG